MLQTGFVKMSVFATGGMLMAMVGNVGVGLPEISVLLLALTQRSIEMTLIAEVGVVECPGCSLCPQMPHSGSVMFESATFGTLMAMGVNVGVESTGSSVLVLITGPHTIGMTQTVEVEAAGWLGSW